MPPFAKLRWSLFIHSKYCKVVQGRVILRSLPAAVRYPLAIAGFHVKPSNEIEVFCLNHHGLQLLLVSGDRRTG